MRRMIRTAIAAAAVAEGLLAAAAPAPVGGANVEGGNKEDQCSRL